MTKLNRFKDLKAKGFVDSWPQLKRMVELYGFPPGKLLTPDCRVWTDEELDAYVASRPVKREMALRGAAKIKHARRKAAQPEAEA